MHEHMLPSSPHLLSPDLHVPWRHLALLPQPTPSLVEQEADHRRTSRAQGDQSMPMASLMDQHWPRAAPALEASPGPPRCTLSFAAAAPTHQTRARALAQPAAVDIVAIFSAPVPPDLAIASARQAVPHLASKRASIAWTPPT
jgi:hypothetical protein